jgi:PBP1b-binding outer membrane lipoprotein LpoB
MSNIFKLVLPAAVLLSGCANLNAPMSDASGTFAASQFKEQVVDPKAAEGAPEMDAAMSAAAIERYRTGKTKKPASESEGELTINLAPTQ